MEIIPLEIISASIVLFAVIDILGSLPIIINLKNQNRITSYNVCYTKLLRILGHCGNRFLGIHGADNFFPTMIYAFTF